MRRIGAKLRRIPMDGICSSVFVRTLKSPLIPPPKTVASPCVRYFSSKMSTLTTNPVALEMIKYAISLTREQKTEEALGRGLLVLEQCETTQSDDNSKGLVGLARSTLLFERGCHEAAIESLGKIQELNLSSIGIKVAASEALVGIYLELYQDDVATVVTDLALRLLGSIKLEMVNVGDFGILEFRVKALKGLIELIHGSFNSAQSFFEGVEEERPFIGSVSLSYGEFLHGNRNFSTAKEFYQKVIQEMPKNFSDPNNLGTCNCNMSPEEVSISAACALGQLEAHMGNFNDAETILTEALSKTEEYFGFHHPKVGVILTCIALMYRLKAVVEHSSSLLIQEGLFRKAIELLKAPSLDNDSGGKSFHGKDVIALARGGYAETLLVQQPRKAEGERLKKWAEAAWSSRWMSLGEALELSKSSRKVPVIDSRICRVI